MFFDVRQAEKTDIRDQAGPRTGMNPIRGPAFQIVVSGFNEKLSKGVAAPAGGQELAFFGNVSFSPLWLKTSLQLTPMSSQTSRRDHNSGSPLPF